MKERLIETSSIFYQPVDAITLESQLKKSIQPTIKEMEEVLGKENFQQCRIIPFGESSDRAKICLKEFLPDSAVCVLHDKHMDFYFAANMRRERIFYVPFKKYEFVVATPQIVVLKINSEDYLEYAEYEKEIDTKVEFLYLVLDGTSFEVLTEFEYKIEGKDLIYKEKKYSLESTEVEEPSAVNMFGKDAIVYKYKDDDIIHFESNFLYCYDKRLHKTELLADNTGSYLGFYLTMSEEGKVLVRGVPHRTLTRLSYSVAIFYNEEDEEAYVISYKNTEHMKLSELTDEEYTDIPVYNGIPYFLLDYDNNPRLLIFTPQKQEIVLTKADTRNVTYDIGNGLFFKRECVLLLDNGSLIFTKGIDKTTIGIRGREVQIPTEYFGEL